MQKDNPPKRTGRPRLAEPATHVCLTLPAPLARRVDQYRDDRLYRTTQSAIRDLVTSALDGQE